MASSSFRISIVANTLSSFSINALSLGSNRVYVINIMYISLDNSYNAFYTLSIDYNSFVIFRFYIYFNTLSVVCKAEFLFYLV